MPAFQQHAPHAQRRRNLPIVHRIPNYYGAAGGKAGFVQKAQPQLDLALGVNIRQAEQRIKVWADAARIDLLFQGCELRGRQNYLTQPGVAESAERFTRAGRQRTGGRAGVVILHIPLGQIGEGIL